MADFEQKMSLGEVADLGRVLARTRLVKRDLEEIALLLIRFNDSFDPLKFPAWVMERRNEIRSLES